MGGLVHEALCLMQSGAEDLEGSWRANGPQFTSGAWKGYF